MGDGKNTANIKITRMSTDVIQAIFDLLKDNKEFPNYQAERRIDIFINYFLERILSTYLMEETIFVCPEFPLKRSDNNRSTKLDYLYRTKNQPVFVELKTDLYSLCEDQALRYLNCNWNTCSSDLNQIISSTKTGYRTKYRKLISIINSIKFNDENPEIKVIYISPLNDNASSIWRNVNINRVTKLSDLKINFQHEESTLWKNILNLDLKIFEANKCS